MYVCVFSACALQVNFLKRDVMSANFSLFLNFFFPPPPFRVGLLERERERSKKTHKQAAQKKEKTDYVFVHVYYDGEYFFFSRAPTRVQVLSRHRKSLNATNATLFICVESKRGGVDLKKSRIIIFIIIVVVVEIILDFETRQTPLFNDRFGKERDHR